MPHGLEAPAASRRPARPVGYRIGVTGGDRLGFVRTGPVCGGAPPSARVLTAAVGGAYLIKTVLNIQQFYLASEALSSAVGGGTGKAVFTSIVDLGLLSGPFEMFVYAINLALVYATPDPVAMVLNMLALEFVLRFDDDVKALLMALDGPTILKQLKSKYETPSDPDQSRAYHRPPRSDFGSPEARGALGVLFAMIELVRGVDSPRHGALSFHEVEDQPQALSVIARVGAAILLGGVVFWYGYIAMAEAIEYTQHERDSCATMRRRFLGGFGADVYCQIWDGSGKYEFEMRLGADRASELEAPFLMAGSISNVMLIVGGILIAGAVLVVRVDRSLNWLLASALACFTSFITVIAWAAMLAMSVAMMTLGPVCKIGMQEMGV